MIALRLRVVIALTLLGLASTTRAAVLDFNELAPSTIGTHMPDTYQGLRFQTSDWHYMTLASSPADAFLALSGNATIVGSVGGADFYLDGVDFWSRRGLDANGDLYFVLYHNGVTVYDGINVDPDGRRVFTEIHQTFAPNYTGPIDGFAIAFDGNGKDWNHLAMDNLQVRGLSVPEPGVLAPLTLSAMPLLRCRRSRRPAGQKLSASA